MAVGHRASFIVAISGLLCSGCAGAGSATPSGHMGSAVRTALVGDLPSFRREVEAVRERGTRRVAVERLAHAILRRELHSARGDAAVRRIQQLQSCVPAVERELIRRSRGTDDAAAEAAMLLLERYGFRARRWVRYQEHSAAPWRALAARSLATAPELRRKSFSDADERVRRAAFASALLAPAPEYLPELLEAARLDPDPLCRSLAVRGAGEIGGHNTVLALADRWHHADSPTRSTIVEAWSRPNSYRDGGREQLVWVVDTQAGVEAIAAAGALRRVGRSSGQQEDVALGAAVLRRMARDGSSEERQVALRSLTTSDAADVEVLSDAAHSSDDPRVQLAALDLLVEEPWAKEALLRVARGEDAFRPENLPSARSPEPSGAVTPHTRDHELALAAALSLARVQHPAVAPLLEEILHRGGASERRAAGAGLVDLAAYDTITIALGDEDPAVRTAIACTVLRATR